ncbi:MAG TPA: serine/threonine-protein kinase [Ktedonobacteraceae bacterium]|nr:serine/threonine-protein kinase [Ktedonobacteraceae bacterium]
MVNNYPFDPNNPASLSNPATPQSAMGGNPPEYPLPPVAPQALSVPNSAQSAQQVSSGAKNNGNVDSGAKISEGGHHRLPAGTELSFGRYRIEKLVAAGGMGAVYRAIDTRFDRPCAVKEMLDDFTTDEERGKAVEWFKREATFLLDLNHPCIPRVRDFFAEGERHYLVMDFIEGRTLAEVLEKEGNVPGVNGARGVSEARARSWGQQVCSVLTYLHNQKPPVIFRDLKPSNIMVTNQDEIKLIDFGIARTVQSQRQSTIIMTIGYAPPEQLHGMPEPRSDIYALGATLHKVLTRHDAANNKPSIFSFPPVRLLRPDISPAFEQILMKALAPNLEQRWTSAAEMGQAIIKLPPIRVNPPVVAPVPTVPGGDRNTPSRPAVSSNGLTGPAGALIRLAQDHIRAGRIDPAYAVTGQAYALEPNNALVHKLYGQVFARRNQPEQAMQAYNRSLQFNNTDPETHKLVGDVYLYLRRQPAQAIPAYTESLRLNVNDLEAHMRLAKCFEETVQLEPALREYQEAARLDPKQPGIHYTIGQLAWRLNQLPLAERAFVQVLTINPADHQTRFLLSQVYERENKLEEAFEQCKFVVDAMPANTAAQAMLQRLRIQLRR